MVDKARNSNPRLRKGRRGKKFSLVGFIQAKLQEQKEISREEISTKILLPL